MRLYFALFLFTVLISGAAAQEPNASVEQTGSSMDSVSNEVREIQYTDTGISFSGTITAPTPCHEIEHNVTGSDPYVLNVETVENLSEDRVCSEVVTGLKYDANFEAEPGFELEVRHDGEKVEEITHRPPEQSLWQRILRFFRR